MFNRFKKIIKLFIPPIMITLYHRIKAGKHNPIVFSGVFNNVNECPDENPWIQPAWINASKTKLNRVQAQEVEFSGYVILPCLITNFLSSKQNCRVLDFGGGTGFIYFRVFPYLLNPANVQWHVFDRNGPLLRMGQGYVRGHKEYNIQFHTEISKTGEDTFDIVYLNTVLQYIGDYEAVLKNLFVLKPKYVILTRLLAGDMPTYITCQNHDGYRSPCAFVNFKELVRIFSESGYELVYKVPCIEEVFSNCYDSNIPSSLQIPHSMNAVFTSKLN